jgi:hypothetical protein
MMRVVKHIIWQKRTTNCFFRHKRRPKSLDDKKSELIVNFGEAQTAYFHQFYVADSVGNLKPFISRRESPPENYN